MCVHCVLKNLGVLYKIKQNWSLLSFPNAWFGSMPGLVWLRYRLGSMVIVYYSEIKDLGEGILHLCEHLPLHTSAKELFLLLWKPQLVFGPRSK